MAMATSQLGLLFASLSSRARVNHNACYWQELRWTSHNLPALPQQQPPVSGSSGSYMLRVQRALAIILYSLNYILCKGLGRLRGRYAVLGGTCKPYSIGGICSIRRTGECSANHHPRIRLWMEELKRRHHECLVQITFFFNFGKLLATNAVSEGSGGSIYSNSSL